MPRHVSRIHRAIIGLVVTLCAVVGGMPAARADEMTVVDFVAAHLHEQDRLYSPPGTNLLSKAEQARVDRRLFLTETPVYVAVLYPDAWQRYPGDVREIARKLQGNEGEGGTYLVIAGGRVSAYSAFERSRRRASPTS